MNGSSSSKLVRRALNYTLKYSTQSSTAENQGIPPHKTYEDLELDPTIASSLESKKYHARQHPGLLRNNVDSLPEPIIQSMKALTEGLNLPSLAKDGADLCKQLWGRLLPPEKEDYVKNILFEKKRVNTVLREYFPQEVQEKTDIVEKKVVTDRLNTIMHPWYPLNPTPETCLQYLVSRAPAEYCILHKIFREIQRNDPDFSPQSYFDFGSGVASGFWAVTDVWKKPLMEAFLVDININMNELASKILKEANIKVPGALFFRQFLPVAPQPTYDLVMSAFTLLELPSLKDRLESIATLWSKTDKYLVIVEDGTNAGYNAVHEARNLILHLGRECSRNGEASIDAHIFSPCPHDLSCPRFSQDNTPCNYEISYMTPQFLQGRQTRKSHLYSYVVIKRGPRPDDDRKWPRCVRETMTRNQRVHMKLCTSEGELKEVTLLKNRLCKAAYQCARKTKWGDLLPGQIVTKEKPNLPPVRKSTLDDQS